ncbi:MFS transporter [Pandoraea sp. PE-S2R-1]|uniref:MFS transporter n=1 Tax=Pandoraea sp. PE-S2R-1 TaxID=1986994 RepID=UPI000B3FCB7B|nr:MFS transporter [Pandoraea sp. PE-S2R-1]
MFRSNASPSPTPHAAPLRRADIWLMALACGLAVANLNYCHPMLGHIGTRFDTSGWQLSLVPAAAQLGYAAGLLLLTPLGDRVADRRRLIVWQMLGLCASLLLAASAPHFWILVVASFAIGVTGTVAQHILPLAAQLAQPERRGAVVGTVVSGLLIGILGARTLAGWVATWWHWRAMFGMAALAMLCLAALLGRRLPYAPPTTSMTYSALLRSMITLFRRHRALRASALIGGLLFAAFSAFWSTLTLWLASPVHGQHAGVAGTFGVIGIAGALAAPLAGRLTDRGGPHRVLWVGIGAVVLSFAALWAGQASLVGLAFGVIVLDLGVQTGQIANQTRIFALDTDATSRLNTLYMSVYFLMGALGSALGVMAWSAWGWDGVCAFGVVSSLLACAVHASGKRGARFL